MNDLQSELLESIRQQFDNSPYPRIPLEQSPKQNPSALYLHNLVTAFYIRDSKVIDTKGKTILDAGCGSGYKSLVLAEANPGAEIIGVDLSEESVKLAEQRLQYHGFNHAKFYPLSIEELHKLNRQYDYINCDEVLYLLPDPIAGLKAMQAVLKPDGILRVNFHSSLQRAVYHRTQEFFKLVGLIGNADQETEIETVRETFRSLRDDVFVKNTVWKPVFETDDQAVLANYLLRGDKGYTIPEFFAALKAANLEFISMVQWRLWNLLNLFENLAELPIALIMSLAEKTPEEQLHLFELLHPIHRLLDLWCGHPRQATAIPMGEWQLAEWQQATVHLHPQLNTQVVKEDLLNCLNHLQIFQLHQHLPISEHHPQLDSSISAFLLPLWEEPQPFQALVERWINLRPIHHATLEPISREAAVELFKQPILQLEEAGYLLLELSGQTTIL